MKSLKKLLGNPAALASIIVAIVTLFGMIIQSNTTKEIALLPFAITSTVEAKLTQLSYLNAQSTNVPSETPTAALTLTPNDIVFGPHSGIITAKSGIVDEFTVPGSGTLENFSLRMKISSPFQATDAIRWDFGVGFRNNDSGSYDLVVDSTGGWMLRQWIAENNTYTKIASDYGSKGIKLNVGEGDINELILSVSGDKSCFSINGMEFIETDLPSPANRGKINIFAGYFQGNSLPGKDTAFSDLTVYSEPLVNCR